MMRTWAATLALVALLTVPLLTVALLAAPATAEFEPDSTGMSDAPLTVEQEAAIAATVVRGLEDAWKEADVDAWYRQFWPDAETVNLEGGVSADRDEIRERQAALWSGILKGSRIRMTIRRVRGLGTAALLVETDNEVAGYDSLPAGVRARTDGTLASRESLVLLNRFGKWRILSAQETAVMGPPAGPPAGRKQGG